MSTGFAQESRAAPTRFEEACAAITTQDLRADDRRRQVTLGRERVTIQRSFRGIAMRLSVPVATYRGVCMALEASQSGGFTYQIRLDHRDADLSVPLAEAPDDRDIWAEWHSWARFFGLPALVERNEGAAIWGPNPGLAQARAAARRRVKRRRPGFMARRAAARGGAVVIHRDQELIGRD